ncbi:hypothetical protein BST61_g7947 [Cercospora zeina]
MELIGEYKLLFYDDLFQCTQEKLNLDHGHAGMLCSRYQFPKNARLTMFWLNWSSISCFLLLAASFTSALPAQDDPNGKQAVNDESAVASVTDDLARINNDVSAFYSALSSFNGGFFGALSQGPQIQSASSQLLGDIQSATQNAKRYLSDCRRPCPSSPTYKTLWRHTSPAPVNC